MSAQKQAKRFKAMVDGENAIRRLLGSPVLEADDRQYLTEALRNFKSVKMDFYRETTCA